MTTVCIPAIAAMQYQYTGSEIPWPPGEERYPMVRSDSRIRVSIFVTTNENWRGKNDREMRRRIQNRLNQRAFRERQRAGGSPKQYKLRLRSMSAHEQEEESDSDEEPRSPPLLQSIMPLRSRAEDPRWDELGRLINRNVMSAAVTNARHLGVDLGVLQSGVAATTPRPTDGHIPAALTPVELQFLVPHDPIIDIIPHARLRLNIMRAIATRQLDSQAFSRCIRGSGALAPGSDGLWTRGGVVVWSVPEQLASWELSELFVRTWHSLLLRSCEDFITATNVWRKRRGERLFSVSLDESSVMMSHS